MNKDQCLQKFKNAANSGEEAQAVAALNEFRRDYVDMYFVREEFSREFTTLLYDEFDHHAKVWEHIYTTFKSFILDKDLLSVFCDPRAASNFWMYEAFVKAGAPFPQDNLELMLCAVQGGSWEIVQHSIANLNIEKYPETVFIALDNSDERVHQNLYHVFPHAAIDDLCAIVGFQKNVLWTQDCPPNNTSRGYRISEDKMDRFKDFLSEQQKLRVLDHINDGEIVRSRKM